MLKIAILASTRGTSMQGIIEQIKNKSLNVELMAVISNKKSCLALEKARQAGFPDVFIDPANKELEEYDQEISKFLDEKNIELIVLVGYMKLFSPWFVEKYRNRIINVHPSLLPSFPGMNLKVHQEVLDYGCKISGCSFFFIDEGKDTGPLICQKCVEITEKETINSLKNKVQDLEIKWFPEVIRWYAEKRIKIEGRNIQII